MKVVGRLEEGASNEGRGLPFGAEEHVALIEGVDV